MIQHLADPVQWALANEGDKRPYESASLAIEGFIHMSTLEQVPQTFARFYSDRTDLVLLDIDEQHPDVARHLKWEEAPEGVFPHLYSRLPLDAVKRARPCWVPSAVPVGERFPFAPGYDDGSATYDPERFGWPEVEAELVDSKSYWVTSVRPDGRPHAAPVWGIWVGDGLAFSSSPGSVKGRNLAANPSTVVHLESGDVVVIVEGVVEPLEGHHLDAFIAGYGPKYGMTPDPENPDHGMYLVRPTTARTWLEAAFLETATMWRF